MRVEAELGGDVYGPKSIFRANEHRLPAPATTDELRQLLHRHVYAEDIRLDDHSLRVLTDDDEVALAYFLVDDHVIAAEPARLAYLRHDTWPLPEDVGEPQARGARRNPGARVVHGRYRHIDGNAERSWWRWGGS